MRKRLKNLTEDLSQGNLGIVFISSSKSRAEFAGKVSDTRNYLTHYDPEKPLDISTRELGDLVEKLSALLEVCLLWEIGFDFITIRKLTAKHWRYMPIFRRW